MIDHSASENAPSQSALVEGATIKNPQRTPLQKAGLQKAGFVLLNVWLVYHLFSITIATLAVAPASELEGRSWEFSSRYLQCMYLNHGFHFFAPEPAGATTVGYELEYQDGRTEKGRFPTKVIQPRLLYHRHLMLTEFLASSIPEDVEQQKVWHRAYARNLCRRSGAERVTLVKIRHRIAPEEHILAGGKLDDPELFEEELIGTFHRNELFNEGESTDNSTDNSEHNKGSKQ